MALHTGCPRRIASTCVHRTVWRRRGVRCYASSTANDPEWFQQLRTQLLRRKPLEYREHLDPVHHEQLHTTLSGFQPKLTQPNTGPESTLALSDVLTYFNARVKSFTLLADGTDPLHSPGEPWSRRMWAGGAVKLNPGVKLHSETPFRLLERVACIERIKDVRLQGAGNEAKIFVTIERRFAYANQSRDAAKGQIQDNVRVHNSQVIDNDEWSDALVKEERNLVFLKSKTAAELVAAHAGQTLVPRYLTSPTEPDFSYTLTPTRSLLFRYSAVTFNAHLLHLDPTYARNIEGHRNLLVHGPLTLTLMLQTLNKYTLHTQIDQQPETVGSIEYRNLAPLYCDEKMRVCVKNRKKTDTGNIWDVWIEGPTGGMAVKAVVRTIQRATVPPTDRAADDKTNKALPDVETIAVQAKARLNALDQQDSGREQLSKVSRVERRKLWRQEQQQLTRKERRDWAARALSYLYSASSPLVVRTSQSTSDIKTKAPDSVHWRKRWVGKALKYLYLENRSPLISPVVVPRAPDSMQNTESESLQTTATGRSLEPVQKLPASSFDSATSGPPSLAQRQRAALLASTPAGNRKTADSTATAPIPATSELQIHKVGTEGPEHVLPLRSMQKATDVKGKSPAARQGEESKPLTIRKVEQVSVRKVDIALQETARKREHEKRSLKAKKNALKSIVLRPNRAAERPSDAE